MRGKPIPAVDSLAGQRDRDTRHGPTRSGIDHSELIITRGNAIQRPPIKRQTLQGCISIADQGRHPTRGQTEELR